MTYSKKNIGLRIFVGCLFILGTSTCSVFTPEKSAMSDSEACVKLNELIADHSNHFKQFKKGRLNANRMTYIQAWNAQRVFSLAQNCQVWEWSTGLTNYYCAWQEPGEVQAKASHDKGVAIVEQCLGRQWQTQFDTTTSGGGSTLFSTEGSKTIVSIRYFKESRTIIENWRSTLYVGNESNLDAKVQ